MKKSRSKQDIANNITFLFSALWHGFYPGYFISFFHWSLFSILAKYCYKMSLNYPNFDYNNKFYVLLRNLIALSCINYFGCLFMVLDWDLNLQYLKSTQYCMILIIYGGILFFQITGYIFYTQDYINPRKNKYDIR